MRRSSRSWIRAAGIGGFCLATLVPAPGASALRLEPGDIVVAELRIEGGGGGLIHVDPPTGKQRVLSSNDQAVNAGATELFDDPYDVTVTPRGRLLAAEEYDAGDPSDGGVIGVNPRNGKQELVSSNALAVNMGTRELFVDPWGVIALPGSGIVVGDYNAFGGDGGLIGVSEKTGGERVFSSNDQPVNSGSSELLTAPARIQELELRRIPVIVSRPPPAVKPRARR